MTITDIYKHFQKCTSVSTDSRKITPNCMFFALKGDHFNGNAYANSALDKGAKYCIVDEKDYAKDSRYILVDDVLKTLQQLATFHRNSLKTPIIALTGSNGKTTTKELINSVLSTQYKTTATAGNLNNHIGVPLTLLRMTKDTEIGIVEMGANHQKEIEFLCNIAFPDYGVITNFGKAHLEGFGGVEGVIKGKSELYDHLKVHHKTIFVNQNDEIQIKQIGVYKSIYSFGKEDSIGPNPVLKSSQPFVTLDYKGNTINSQLTGEYNFNNIIAAIAFGEYFKIKPEHIKMAIENYIPTNNRSQFISKGSNTLLMDAYNANPTSMKAALLNFEKLNHKIKIAILGDMFELGKDAEKEHQYIADLCSTLLLDKVILVGENFFKSNLVSTKVIAYKTFEDFKNNVNLSNIQNTTVLIKGSRGMALERVLELL